MEKESAVQDESKDLILYSKSKKRKTIYVVLSLLLHAFIFLFMMHYGFRKQTISLFESLTKTMTPEEKKAREEERKLKALQNLQKRNALNALRVAKLKPKQSSFGWVYFQDPPDNKQPEIPTTLDKPLDVVKQVLATETEEQEQAIPAPEKIVQKDIGKEKTPPVKKLADSNG